MTLTHPSLPIGIIGLNFGSQILEELQRDPAKEYFTLAAVCDLEPAKLSKASEQYGVKACHSLAELLEDPEIPVVGLFTGPFGRADLLKQILRAGKDVMTTKPFELDPEAAREVLEEARALGRVILLNSPSPSLSPSLQKIQDWRERFDLGHPISCRGEVVCSYREQADGGWLDDPEKCPCAPIFRLGIYLINDLVGLFGGVEGVQVQSTRIFTGRPTADNAQLSLQFQNGALGTIFASFCVDNGQFYGNSLMLHFERGTILRNVHPFAYGQAGHSSHLSLITTDGNQNVVTENWESNEGSGGYPWKELAEAVHGRTNDIMPIAATVHGIQVIEAMTRASKSHHTEKVHSG